STNTDNTVTEPWMFSDKKQYIRDAINFRYKLSPMLYSLMVRAHESGLPIWQPTFAVFQNDPATYDEGVDFMFGDSLLVANVVEKGQTVRPVYLPKTENENERFYNFYTREEYAPGQTIEVPVDISSIPLFVRSGAILPMSGNRLHNLMTEKTTELEILMAPDVDSEFVLYEDDGCTNEYLKGAYLKTRIAVTAGVKTYVHFTNEGDYDTAVESMYLDMIHREKSPFYVQLDGKELPHFLHRRKFEEAESGWYYSQRLKSVQVKYPNPKKDHEVMVSFEQFDLIGM
ncbi:MAG TPA: alpha-glucosidase, partial [Ruminococcaceae bacterium]|nr:alpha-glucosidase [Oscillospiraceae bacterium]